MAMCLRAGCLQLSLPQVAWPAFARAWRSGGDVWGVSAVKQRNKVATKFDFNHVPASATQHTGDKINDIVVSIFLPVRFSPRRCWLVKFLQIDPRMV